MRLRFFKRHPEYVVLTIVLGVIYNMNRYNNNEDLYIQSHRMTSVFSSESSSRNISEVTFTIDDIKSYRYDLGVTSRVNKLIYVHVPKTGGTTIEKLPLFDDSRAFYDLGLRDFNIGGHAPIGRLKESARLGGIDGFVSAAHIRHPCERFISAFRYLTSTKCNKGDQAYAKEHIGDMTLDQYIAHSHSKGWKDFANWPHFKKQHLFLVNNNEFDVDHILCQEQWDEGIERLYHAVGNDDIPSDFLHNDKEKKDESKEIHMLQNKHETCADLNPATRRSIETYYAMDYCLFEYERVPNSKNGQCIGTTTTKEQFNEKFQACKQKMAEMNENNDYDSLYKYLDSWSEEDLKLDTDRVVAQE